MVFDVLIERRWSLVWNETSRRMVKLQAVGLIYYHGNRLDEFLNKIRVPNASTMFWLNEFLSKIRDINPSFSTHP